MLKKLRKRKNAKKIWIVLTVLILPAFLFWGFGSLSRSKENTNYAGSIAGRKVSLSDYKDALSAAKNQAIIQFGDNISEIEDKINLGALAWNRLILLAEARKRRLNVSDKEVIELIQSYPFFQRKGSFDNQVYSQILQYVFRTQPRVFEEETRQNLILSKLYKEVTGDISLSDEEIRKEYLKLNEELSIHYIVSVISDFTNEVNPAEGELRNYFAKNSLQFKEPLSFNIEYISLDSEDNSGSPAKDKINSLALLLSKGGDFAKSAEESGLEVKETGFFSQSDPVPGIGWSPQILNLISSLKTGEFAGPIYIDKYYYILRLKEKKEPHIPDFEAIADKVKEAFIKESARDIARSKIEDSLRDLKAAQKTDPKSSDIYRTAKERGLKADSTSLFKYGSYIEGIGSSDVFFTVAETLKEDEISGIIEMPSGFYIIKLKSKVPVDENLYNEEKDAFTGKLLLRKQEAYFNSFLEGLRKKAQIAGY
ncbi:MAG: SurA N-terminal domain-containing protein [Candidatus Omnitrophota bacterium]|jgi:hypothetical protein